MNELQLTLIEIQKATPYLDELYYEHSNSQGSTTRKTLTTKMRAFAWFFVFNGNSAAAAYRLSHTKRKKSGKHLQNSRDAGQGYELRIKQHIKEAIKLIQEHITINIKETLSHDIVTTFKTMATYDPLDIIDEFGGFKYEKVEDVPKHLRCCIKSITYRGGLTTVHLVDRQKALEKLLEICPELLEPTKHEVTHLTKDDQGNIVGFNPAAMSDEELKLFVMKNEKKVG